MQQVRLGKSELKVTKVGFGGIPLQRLTAEAAIDVIRYALAQGVNWLDTAHGYGHSEEVMGQALKSFKREDIKVFTKAPGATPERLKEQVELSFKRLQIDYIDLYQFHQVKDLATWETMQQNGTLGLLLDLKARGKIRHIGASAHSLPVALKLLDHPAIEVIQWPFNFIVQPDGEQVINKCLEKDAGFIAMKPFGGGMLENAQVCLRFLLQFPSVVCDPGFEKITEVAEVISLVREGLLPTGEDRLLMEKMQATLGKEFCRRCGYCSPCPQGVEIVTLMLIESLIKRLPPQKIVSGWVADSVRTVEKCTVCGLCESKCPYELKIMTRIAQGAERFKAFKAQHPNP